MQSSSKSRSPARPDKSASVLKPARAKLHPMSGDSKSDKRPMEKPAELVAFPASCGVFAPTTSAEQEAENHRQLLEILLHKRLSAVFQPIISMHEGRIAGYEGLIRGPSDSHLHSPVNLFSVAKKNGLTLEVERLCRQVVLGSFARLGLPGKLFLNVSPDCLMQPHFRQGETLGFMREINLSPERVIIELTENEPTYDYNLLREATLHYRSMGFEIAIDDLGEGFSSLRLWSELRPDYVKIDKHFIQSINQDPVKLQFVRSIQQIADNCGSKVIAEGIETQAEFMIMKDLGISLGQGYYIARPSGIPAVSISPEIINALGQPGIIVYPHANILSQKTVSARKLLIDAPHASPETPNEHVYKIFAESPALNAVPVVRNGIPVGLISRHKLIDSFSKLYSRELYGKKPCAKFMDDAPLIVDKDISIQELSKLVVASERRYLSEGFILTDQGQYAGIGTGHDLMREITEMQINAARYANPLTLLPGNVPINEHIDRLLQSQARFVTCYCDLDHFKPFNDRYGYRKGDDVIQLTGKILIEGCDPERDFIGHIGGDDFVILFQSHDWEDRCKQMLERFERAMLPFFSAPDIEEGGYFMEDRRGQQVYYSLLHLSLGAVAVDPDVFSSHHEIAAVAAEAKKQAKRMPGSSLFFDRRKYCLETCEECNSADCVAMGDLKGR